MVWNAEFGISLVDWLRSNCQKAVDFYEKNRQYMDEVIKIFYLKRFAIFRKQNHILNTKICVKLYTYEGNK